MKVTDFSTLCVCSHLYAHCSLYGQTRLICIVCCLQIFRTYLPKRKRKKKHNKTFDTSLSSFDLLNNTNERTEKRENIGRRTAPRTQILSASKVYKSKENSFGMFVQNVIVNHKVHFRYIATCLARLLSFCRLTRARRLLDVNALAKRHWTSKPVTEFV